jgi:pimeloyl-ACP methyl ester carboxylesterase
MAHHLLITGSAGLLAGHLAALQLSSTDDTVSLLLQGPDGMYLEKEQALLLVRDIHRRGVPAAEADAGWERLRSRLHCLQGPLPREEPRAYDKVWHLSGGSRPTPGSSSRAGDDLLRGVLRLGIRELNHVGPLLTGGAGAGADGFEALHRAAEHEVEAACVANGVGYRLFRVGLVVGEVPAVREAAREGFLQMLEALHDLREEVEERSAGFITSRPVRCLAPASASLGLVRVEKAAEALLRIAGAPDTLAGRFRLVAPERIPFSRLCEEVGAAYALKLRTVETVHELNAVDRSLHERLAGFPDWLTVPGGAAPDESWGRPVPSPEELGLDASARQTLFQAIRREQDAALSTRKARAAKVFESLEKHTLDRGSSTLTYYTGGTGEVPLILLNALGQGLVYWQRLLDCLVRSHRVIIWEPRGLESGPQPFLMRDQLEDLEAVLRNEGVDRCHLVGWCTGPKLSVEFYLRRPAAVASMVFLNASFRCIGIEKEFETDYERNFDPLCKILARRPAMAASLLKSLRMSMSREAGDLNKQSDADAANRVLSLASRDVKPHTVGALRDENVAANYSQQILDFWSYDTRITASQVKVPVFLLSTEYDAVAAPAAARHMAKSLLPNAHHVHVAGATHYCLYDRPEFVAGHIGAFLRSLDEAPSTTLAAGAAASGTRS